MTKIDERAFKSLKQTGEEEAFARWCIEQYEAAKASQQPEQEQFEVFMLAVHEHGTSGLGYRKALAEYEAAKKKPDVEALIAKLDDYFLLDKRERISAAFALTVFDIIRKWAKGQA